MDNFKKHMYKQSDITYGTIYIDLIESVTRIATETYTVVLKNPNELLAAFDALPRNFIDDMTLDYEFFFPDTFDGDGGLVFHEGPRNTLLGGSSYSYNIDLGPYKRIGDTIYMKVVMYNSLGDFLPYPDIAYSNTVTFTNY